MTLGVNFGHLKLKFSNLFIFINKIVNKKSRHRLHHPIMTFKVYSVEACHKVCSQKLDSIDGIRLTLTKSDNYYE